MKPLLWLTIAGCIENKLGGGDEVDGFDSTPPWDSVGGDSTDSVIDTDPPPAPDIEVTPTYVPFPTTALGESGSELVAISNVGTAPLNVTGVAWSEGDSGPFTLTWPTSSPPFVLDPGASVDAAVTFSPTAAGSFGRSALVQSDDPDEAEVLVELHGDVDCEGGEPGDFFVIPVASGAGLLATVASNGDGTFQAPETVDPGLGERADSFAIADFNEDGSLDIVARGETSDHLYLLTGGACGASWSATDLGSFGVHIEGGADLDGDGDVDLVGVTDAFSAAEVWLGNGDGTFTELPGALDLSAVYSGYAVKAAAHAADVSGDGIPDLAITDYDSMGEDTSRLWLALGQGDGSFDRPVNVGTIGTGANGVDLADLDQDGHPDVLGGLDDDGDAGVLFLAVGEPGGVGSPIEIYDMNPGAEGGTNSPGAGRVHLHDWDGDTYPDPLISFQEDAYSPGFNTLFLLAGLDDLTVDRSRDLSEVGNVETIHFAVPLE